MKKDGAKARKAVALEGGRSVSPADWAIHGLAALWLAWVVGAVAYAGDEDRPWVWALYSAAVYLLAVASPRRGGWAVWVLWTAAAWFWEGWGRGLPAGPAAGPGGGFPVPAPGGLGAGAAAAADQAGRIADLLLSGDWLAAAAAAGGPLGRLLSLLLCALTAWAFARSVERAVLWTWLLAGEIVLALTDSFLVSQKPALVGTVALGVMLAALSRGWWWGPVRRVPWRAALAGILVASLVVGAGIAVPKAGPVWPDPLHWFGGRSGFGAVKKIGYGEDDRELGGPFVFDGTVAFAAISPEPVYYRGETRDVYTGRGWENKSGTPGDRAVLRSLLQGSPDLWPPESRLRRIPVKRIRQEIWVQNGSLPVLVGAYPLSRLVELTRRGEIEVRVDPAGRWVSAGKLGPGDHYVVESEVPAALPEELKRAAPAAPESLPPSVRADLQLPPSLPARVRALAREITGGESSVYGKARAIVEYLQAQYRYETRDVPVPRRDQDFVDQFLFESKAGYCDHFSTAMAVLARSAGIPARWVKGFTPGELDAGQPDQAGGHRYLIRNSNAHSWVEIWIPGYGWIPFDPTPGFAAGQSPAESGRDPAGGSAAQTPPAPPPASPENGGPAPEPGRAEEGRASPGGGGEAAPGTGAAPGRIGAVAVGIAVAALLGAAVWRAGLRGGRIRLRRRSFPALAVLAAGSPPADADAAVLRLQRWYVEQGGVLVPGTTLRDIAAAVVASAPRAAGPAERLVSAIEAAQYGGEAGRARAADLPGLWEDFVRALGAGGTD
ncbi:MAG: transglutaminase domain-containing protein [Alicyclobacillaceae bacterium]|nr:transglutaminase domain-containing protein [Alicyclobacillaceae bacterium]